MGIEPEQMLVEDGISTLSRVKKGQTIFNIYSESGEKLKYAIHELKKDFVIEIR